jgi:transcriptional regulator with GAF, ATPase, and Fis domain
MVEQDQRRVLVARLLSAVGAIHAAGILHRDLKDTNVLLEQQDGRTVVIDFGLACLESEVAKCPLAGTPRSMAPELFTGGTSSRASDLWATGLLLTEALLGRRLFVGRDPAAMAVERSAFTGFTQDEASRLGEPALVALLERLLDPDPEARPEDAAAAMASLPVDDEREARVLADAQLYTQLWSARAAADPCRARGLASLRFGSMPIHLAPSGPFEMSEARETLLEYAAALPDPSEAVRARLMEDASFPASPSEIALLAEALAKMRPLVVDLGATIPDDTEQQAVQKALRAVPRVTVFLEPMPTDEEARSVCREWLGERKLLEERLTAATPRRWKELSHALAELVRAGVVSLGPGGLSYDESRLPASWPMSEEGDPAPGVSLAGRDVLALLAASPWPLRRSTVHALLGPTADEALSETGAFGLTFQTALHPEAMYELSDGRLRRRLLAHRPLSPALRVACALQLVNDHDAGENNGQDSVANRDGFSALPESLASAVAEILGEQALPADGQGGGPEPSEVAQVALRAAAVFRRLGRYQRLTALLRRGLAGSQPGSDERVRLHRELIESLTLATRLEEAQGALDAARAEMPDEWSWVLSQARILEMTGKVEDGLELLGALELEGLDREEAVFSLQLRSDLLRRLGRLEEAMTDLREAVRLQGDVESFRTITLLHRLATLEFRLGNPSDAIRHHEHCLSMIDALSLDVHRWSVTFDLGRAVWKLGERRRGLALQEEAVRLCDVYGQRYRLVTVLFGAGSSSLELGRVDAARRFFDRALRLAQGMDNDVQVARALNNLAMALAAEGRNEEAEESFGESFRIRTEKGDAGGRAAVALARGPIRLVRGDLEGARADLLCARQCAEEVDGRGWEAQSDLLEASLALAEGRPEEALVAASRAHDLAESRGVDTERILALQLLARSGGSDLENEDVASMERSPEVADLALARAESLASNGKIQEAQEDLSLALAILGETPSGPVEARVLLERLKLDLDRLHKTRDNEGSDFALIGDLVSRAVPDGDRIRALVDRFGLKPLEDTLIQLEQRIAAMDDNTESNGLGAMARRMRDFERLVEINKLLATERDDQKLLDLIVDSAIDLTGAARGFIILFKGRSEEFRAARNIDESTIRDPHFQVSHSVARGVARDGEPLLTANAIDDQRLASAASITELKLLSILCVPLRGRSSILGALYVDHPQVVGRFEANDLATVSSLSEQAAIAIENARLSEGLKESNKELRSSREEVDRLNDALQERLEKREAELEETRESLENSQRALALRYDYGNIVTRSPRMHALLDMMDRVTDTDFVVVIYGESGTGKELMARAIHFNGARRNKNFLTLNCAALPESLAESELFGHVRGAFTGADRDREGLFAQADGGTLFLDEIGDMSLEVQKRLLRVLQEGEFIPVGGREVRKVDVRILCATHRNLRAMIETGEFREDLLYRLDVARIELPPLRERSEDIALLVPHFLERHGAKNIVLDPEGLALLERYQWPGNVRELENFVMTMLLFGRDDRRIDVSTVRQAMQIRDTEAEPRVELGGLAGAEAGGALDTAESPLKARLDDFERQAIRDALLVSDGNKAQAARSLGVSVRSLYKMIERLDI